MFTVAGRVRHQIDPVKGSRFIATVTPVAAEDQARTLVADVSAEMPDASHHCTAWRIARPAIDRCSDDGEPGGSAGRPILAVLTGRELVDVAVVVTRYFGGTKLGVGGLVRAYGAAAAAALDTVDIVPFVAKVGLRFTVEHRDLDRVIRGLTEMGAEIEQPIYGQAVELVVSVPSDEVDRYTLAVADLTAGRARTEDA